MSHSVSVRDGTKLRLNDKNVMKRFAADYPMSKIILPNAKKLPRNTLSARQ